MKKRFLSILCLLTLMMVSLTPVFALGEGEASGTETLNISAGTLEELNIEFKSAVKRDPYTVFVLPPRASGWVTLRWAPSTAAEVIAIYGAKEELTVIRELTEWLQVEDPDTGDVGFIRKHFVIR